MLAQSIYKVPDGKLLRISVEYEADSIVAVQIHGDFFLYPEEAIIALEGALIQAPISKDEIISRLQEVLIAYDATFVGADAQSIAYAILLATGKITS